METLEEHCEDISFDRMTLQGLLIFTAHMLPTLAPPESKKNLSENIPYCNYK